MARILGITRKHNAMYELYGIDTDHICRNCCNFEKHRVGNKTVSKCKLYGVTGSSASDWNGRKTACSRFNDSTEVVPVIEQLKHTKCIDNRQCRGQIEIIQKEEIKNDMDK